MEDESADEEVGEAQEEDGEQRGQMPLRCLSGSRRVYSWTLLGGPLWSQRFLGASWVPLGSPLGSLGGRLGAFSGPPGGILVVTRGLLGASSGHLGGLVGAPLGPPGVILGPSWRLLGPTAVEHLKRKFHMLFRGEAPGAPWDPQDMSWAPSAPCRALLKPSWGPPGALLGPPV